MTEGMSCIESSQWRNIDNTSDPGSFVAFLDEITVPMWDVLPEAIRLLEVNTGCSVLDVGSGAGKFLIELASSVDGVRAVGIDASQTMVTTATSRAQAAGVAVQFALGDAQRLDFPDESFDRVNCSLVLVHMEDPSAVVAEIARVLVPGGRVAIFEPDADSLMIDSDDLDDTTALRRQFVAGLQNPDISRRLRRLVLDSGLDLLEASRVTLGEFDLFDYLDDVARVGNIAAEVVEQWRTEIEAADPSGRPSMPAVVFRVLATKPPR
jgi:SAM-dependent methyltransferase